VVVTGIIEALLLLDLATIASTTYGRLLLVKLAVVTLVAALALTARLLLRRGATAAAQPSLPARIEAGALVVVLAVTGLLTSGPTPRPVTQTLALAPPPVGPVLPVGSRAGQIGVLATASAGQLVVHLSAPGAGTSGPPPRYRLAATLADPAGRTRPLALRGCGTGCFVSPLTWPEGTSQVSLQVAADRSRGDTVALAVPWPPRPDSQLLNKVIAAMRRVPSLTLYEEVTSDTTRPVPHPMQLTISGQHLLDSEPYGNGLAPIAVRPAGSSRVLAVAFPAVGQYAWLQLTPDGRIEREVLIDPNHRTTRRFVYPERS
jgi:copper transport protein